MRPMCSAIRPQLGLLFGLPSTRRLAQPARQLHRQLLPSRCTLRTPGRADARSPLPKYSGVTRVHNIEGQYIKAAKNMASIFAGFGYTFHSENPGVLPTLLTLLLEQCLDRRHGLHLTARSSAPLPPAGHRSRSWVTAFSALKRLWCAMGIWKRCATTRFPSSPRWWLMCAAA